MRERERSKFRLCARLCISVEARLVLGGEGGKGGG